ncbi:hypothetical protein J6590_077030 [Homalodisca vitripennis]|nr:hypothetical protein J6590_077030 [Homalodisca vitripennis]
MRRATQHRHRHWPGQSRMKLVTGLVSESVEWNGGRWLASIPVPPLGGKQSLCKQVRGEIGSRSSHLSLFFIRWLFIPFKQPGL